MHLEASTKPHVHQKFEIFLDKYCIHNGLPKLQNRPKNGLRHLGVKAYIVRQIERKRKNSRLNFVLTSSFMSVVMKNKTSLAKKYNKTLFAAKLANATYRFLVTCIQVVSRNLHKRSSQCTTLVHAKG
jgi:hypothetical protein